jgi:CheY-like chemotaxis protein
MKRVLLADDSVAARKSIQTVLEVAGIDVIAVGNGDLALSRLEEVAPEMVLLDAIMPGTNGYEVCAEIKADSRYTNIPVLLISSEFEPFDEALAETSRADGHLIKPLDMNAIAVMRDVWARYSPGDAETLAAVGEAGTPVEAHPTPAAAVMPSPDTFITATSMRVADIEAEAARRAAKAAPAAADPEDTVPAGSGGRSASREGWRAAVPDSVVDVTDTPVGHPAVVRRAPTTENLDMEIAAEAEDRAAARDTVRSVPIQELHAAGERCSECGAGLVSGDIFCIACGAMVLVTSEEAERINRTQYCGECRQELLPGEIFCVACGAVV